MTTFTPISALIGGGMIGLSAVLLMLTNGRIAGISGILGSLFEPNQTDRTWKIAFVSGLFLAAFIYGAVSGTTVEVALPHRLELMIVGGLLVGFGSRLGGGCTSGHGVCGVSRFSKRSIVATAVFMAAAIVTVFAIDVAGGGL